ncbi:MAG: CsgG/HfaB family protein [Planctomycetes bacterium]|nr:CsgG/HfaB family protein [Planctomycetota bacterium]
MRFLVALCLCLALASSASAETPRWAIVAGDAPAARSLADLATAELSQWDDVQLVEREEIDRVLAELKLAPAGLIADDRAIELGRLASAHVVILIESLDKLAPPQFRARAMEVRTGVRLLDVLMPTASLEEEVAALGEELQSAKKKWAIPKDKRRYAAFLGVQNEEPGDALTPQAAALTALLEHDLRLAPGVLLLEREQLHRLRREEQLTGAEVELCSAAVLVEAGLRRDESGQGFAVTLRLVSLTGDELRSERFIVAESGLSAVRTELVQCCERLLKLDSPPASHGREDLAREAEIFARRSHWLEWNDRPEEAAALAEAALGLNPIRENYAQAFRAYDRAWRRDDASLNMTIRIHDAVAKKQRQLELLENMLRTARRMHELDWEQLRSTTTSIGPQSLGSNGNPFYPHTPRLWTDPAPPELERLRQEIDAMRLEKFRLLRSARPWSNRALIKLLLERLELSHYFAESPEEVHRQTIDWQRELDAVFAATDQQIEEKGKQSNSSGSQNHLSCLRGENVAALLRQRRLVGDLSSADDEPRTWTAEELAPLWSELSRHERLDVRAVGFAGLADLPGERGIAAAESLVACLEKIPFEQDLGFPPDVYRLDDLAARRLIGTDKLAALIEQRLTEAERRQDPRVLWARLPRIAQLVWAARRPPSQVDRQQCESWARRAIQLLDKATPTNEAQKRAIGAQRSTLITSFVPSNAPLPADLRPLPPGLWRKYEAKPLNLEFPIEFNNIQLGGVHLDPASSDEGGEPQLLVFFPRGERVWIGRAAASGGKVQEIGEAPYNLRGQNFAQRITAALGDGAIFLNTGAPGLAVVRPGSVKAYGAAEGFPGNRLVDMQWLDGALYLSVSNGLARFDPQKETFTTLASSLSVDGPGPLDGGTTYQITDLLTEPDRGAIYLTVQGGPERCGVWRHEPKGNRWTRIYASQSQLYLSPLWRAKDKVRFITEFGWREIDAATGDVETLAGYRPFKRGAVMQFARRYAQVGDHVIGLNGRLYAPNGEVWAYPLKNRSWWWSVMPAPGGFIAHAQTDELIHFQRRSQ